MTEHRENSGVYPNSFSWREWIGLELKAIDEKFNTFGEKIDGIEKAITLLREEMKERREETKEHFHDINGLQKKIDDSNKEFFKTKDHENYRDRIEGELKELRGAKDITKGIAEGKASTTSVYFSYIFGFIGIILGLIKLFR